MAKKNINVGLTAIATVDIEGGKPTREDVLVALDGAELHVTLDDIEMVIQLSFDPHADLG